jgi:hypothetical protein
MKRPAFQFYPADWRNNAKLRRCSHAARGAWIDTLCLLHDSDEYGVLRWSLADLARAVGAPIKLLRELVDKDVLKGADSDCSPYVYVPRHAGQDGEPVTLIESSAAPCWYSSRMVCDEYVRQRRGARTQFDNENQPPKATPKSTPKTPFGADIGIRQGDGPTSSSTSSKEPKVKTIGQLHCPADPSRFPEFWTMWPKTGRKVDRKKCESRWIRQGLDSRADEILDHVAAMKRSRQWLEGFEPAPLTYLNGERWKDPLPPDLTGDAMQTDDQKMRAAL